MELFFFMHDYPRPGEKWKHFKGHVYEIICIAGDTEREELDVVYRDTDRPHLIWARLLRMFMSEVDNENTRTSRGNGDSRRWLMQMNEGDSIVENLRIVRWNWQP